MEGKISEEFWMRKSGERQAQENQNRTSMQGLEMNGTGFLRTAAFDLEGILRSTFSTPDA
jgi:hypothetical protein